MGISHIHVHKNKKPRSPAAPEVVEVVEKRDIVKRDTLCAFAPASSLLSCP
jgi:hypothetical protein